MIDEEKLYNNFIKNRDNYNYSIITAIISGFLIAFAFVLSSGFFKDTIPVLDFFVSAIILGLVFYFINLMKYHHFFYYSISGYLFYRKKFRFSLFFYRLIGIVIFNILGIFIFIILFYYSKLWKTGNSLGLIASKIGIFSLKFFSLSYSATFINSLITGIIGGFIFYLIYEKSALIKFLGLILFSYLVLTGSFRYFLYDFFNVAFTLMIKKQFLLLGLKKYEIITFYDFFFKFLNVFVGNFIGVVFVFLPVQVLADKFKNKT